MHDRLQVAELNRLIRHYAPALTSDVIVTRTFLP